jgi:hypothetical protein
MRAMRAVAAGLVLLLLLLAPARAQLFGAAGLDPRFCEQPSLRQTVVYVDDMMMAEGRTDWALKLSDKLRATLAPGERVTVVRLSPANGQSSELWSGCWPGYSDAERAKLAQQSYFFSRSPLDRLGDQQKFFLQGFGGALTAIYEAAKRPASAAGFAADNAPSKQILRALASDDGRFANSRVTIRAIIYSDLAENSDLGSVFAATLAAASPDYGQRLGSYLRRSVFYAYGVGADVRGSPGFLEAARTFWGTALRSMAATVGGIGADLNVPNTLPVKAFTYAVTLDFGDQKLDGHLSLLTNAAGDLVDSWLGISRLSSAVLMGTFRCAGKDEGHCQLDATTAGGLATKEPSETVRLAGPEASTLKGQLGVKGTKAVFELTAVPAQD